LKKISFTNLNFNPMPAKPNGIWDFKSYTERTWFRDLIFIFLITTGSYVAVHLWFNNSNSNFEYARLNQDQMGYINHIYLDYEQLLKKPGVTNSDAGTAGTSTDKTKLVGSPNDIAGAGGHTNIGNSQVQPKGASNRTSPGLPTTDNAKISRATEVKKTFKDSCISKDTCPCVRVMDYLNNIFEKKLDTAQCHRVKKILSESNSQEATAFLNTTRFKVHSYFWLVGPSAYWEVVYWSLFGVLCSLLFILGAVGSNATTDLGNPQSQFDSSEILGQVAKILYAPMCILIVVLGYSFFSGQNIVNIDASKGLIVFAFIGGFYSSRVISLMDRLKDLLLPNSGTASLPTPAQGSATSTIIQQLKIQLALNPALRTAVQMVAAGPGLNNATVTMQSAGNPTVVTASRVAGDPDGMFTFSGITPGDYSINATLGVTPTGSGALTLKGQQTGQIMTGTAPITITLQ
jgi:hypothetical protein